jgi:hypothetical protein
MPVAKVPKPSDNAVGKVEIPVAGTPSHDPVTVIYEV